MALISRSFTYMNQHNFIFLFKCFVRLQLEYANVIWSPILKKDIQLIENVQQRATTYIPLINHFSYQERLEKLNLPTLKYRRFRGDTIQTYKILHGMYDIDSTHFFNNKNSNRRGHQFSVKRKSCRLH